MASLVPRLADHAAVDLCGEVAGLVMPEASAPGRAMLRRAAVRHASLGRAHGIALPEGDLLRPSEHNPVLTPLLAGETVHVPHADPFAADQLAAQLGGRNSTLPLRGRTVLLVPMTGHGMVLGHVMLIRETEHPAFSPDEILTATELCRWAARCVAGGHLYRQELDVVEDLRRGVLQDEPSQITGISLCYRYLPESRSAQVGGDWFDVFPLPGGEIGIVVGDVMGHGAPAAVGMSQCKIMVRTLASLGMPPDEVLTKFDELAFRLADDYLATCLYVAYDPAGRSCRLANAGHIPAIVIRPGASGEVVEAPTGVPIGVGGNRHGHGFETYEFAVPDASVLALCTDGLVERHRGDLDHELADLCAKLTPTGNGQSLDEACDDVLEEIHESRKDDVTLLMARLLGAPAA
ncbi:MAG: SpoIIE family protein phosphatase [Streptosporangiales bacterium]|nr:SpoIIE family protein phosphatase [Streptosporangiales bacterium]